MLFYHVAMGFLNPSHLAVLVLKNRANSKGVLGIIFKAAFKGRLKRGGLILAFIGEI